jgi:hypothetical protein
MEKSATNFGDVWGRVKTATNIRNLSQLAKVLEIKQPSVSKAKKRGVFPPHWILFIAERYNVASDWLFTGNGPMHYGEVGLNWKREKLKNMASIFTEALALKDKEPGRFDELFKEVLKLGEEVALTKPANIEERLEIAEARILELEAEKEFLLFIVNHYEKIKGPLDKNPEIADLIEGARKVLTSGNALAHDALTRNIKYFSHAVDAENRLQNTEGKLSDLESRLAELETKNSLKNKK